MTRPLPTCRPPSRAHAEGRYRTDRAYSRSAFPVPGRAVTLPPPSPAGPTHRGLPGLTRGPPSPPGGTRARRDLASQPAGGNPGAARPAPTKPSPAAYPPSATPGRTAAPPPPPAGPGPSPGPAAAPGRPAGGTRRPPRRPSRGARRSSSSNPARPRGGGPGRGGSARRAA